MKSFYVNLFEYNKIKINKNLSPEEKFTALNQLYSKISQEINMPPFYQTILLSKISRKMYNILPDKGDTLEKILSSCAQLERCLLTPEIVENYFKLQKKLSEAEIQYVKNSLEQKKLSLSNKTNLFKVNQDLGVINPNDSKETPETLGKIEHGNP